MAVNIKLNGTLVGYPEGSTVSDIVARLAVMSPRVQVHHNGQAVALHNFAYTVLAEDDVVDVKFGERALAQAAAPDARQ